MGTPNLALAHIASNQASKEVTVNATFDGLDKAMNSASSIATADANVVLTAAQFIVAQVFIFTGALTADRTVTVPIANADSNPLHKMFVVQNATTGGFKLTVKTAAGASVDVYAVDGRVVLYADATDVLLVGRAVGTAAGTVAAGNDSRIKNTGTTAGTLAAGDDARITGAAQFVAVPATSTSTGVAGQIAFDGTFAYFCYAANTWVRAAVATF